MKPLVIAHRGASGEAPENTLKAFQLALDQGADGIELDIFLTRDREVVVIHDETIRTNENKLIYVRKATLEELEKINLAEGEKIPTLKEVFERFGKKFSLINVEIKSTGYFTDGIENELLALIKKYNLEEKVIVSSFNPLHLYRLKRKNLCVKRGYLVHPTHWLNKRKIFIHLTKATTVNLDHSWCTPQRIEMYRKMGKQIWVWTVNKEQAMERWIKQGVEAIITNYPGQLKERLKNESF